MEDAAGRQSMDGMDGYPSAEDDWPGALSRQNLLACKAFVRASSDMRRSYL